MIPKQERFVGDLIDELIAEVPPEVWETVPRDLADTIDETLYGEN